MKRLSGVLLASLALIACDSEDEGPILDGGNPDTQVGASDTGNVGVSSPMFPSAACGTLVASGLTPGTTASSPTMFALNQLVGGRLDPEGLINKKHHWQLQLPRGYYHLVLDSKTANGGVNNIGLLVRWAGRPGGDENLLSGNHIGRRYRDARFFEVNSDGLVALEVSPGFFMEDYVLGVFANGTPVPSPQFADCPTIAPLTLGQPASFALGKAGTPTHEHWFMMDLAAGNYTFRVEATQADGGSTNLQYALELLDRFGQNSRVALVVNANEIGTSHVAQGMHSVGELTPFWLRFRNDFQALNMSVTVTRN